MSLLSADYVLLMNFSCEGSQATELLGVVSKE